VSGVKRTYLFVLPFAVAGLLAGCSTDAPSTPSTVTETVTSIPSDIFSPTPSPSQTWNPPWMPTIETVEPRPGSDCFNNGQYPSTWDKGVDEPNSRDFPVGADLTNMHALSTHPIVAVDKMSGLCFDTVVFTIDNTQGEPWDSTRRMWFHAEYVDQVTADGSGFPVDVAGNAFLQLSIGAPAVDWIADKDYTNDADSSYYTLRQVRSAIQHEGQMAFGVGLNAKVKFAVEYGDVTDQATQVVLRVAHE
jgi:hypothetical protein